MNKRKIENMTIIKRAGRIGGSGYVIVPIGWVGKDVRCALVE